MLPPHAHGRAWSMSSMIDLSFWYCRQFREMPFFPGLKWNIFAVIFIVLPWSPGVHGVLVDIILADVNVSLALEVSHHHLLHVAQVPHRVAVGVLRTRFKRLQWERDYWKDNLGRKVVSRIVHDRGEQFTIAVFYDINRKKANKWVNEYENLIVRGTKVNTAKD